MKRRKPRKQSDVDLVVVYWGDDIGLVSLMTNEMLFHCYGVESHSHHTAIPAVIIEDRDFALMEVLNSDLSTDCTWDDVCGLLKHVNFPLMKRIKETK